MRSETSTVRGAVLLRTTPIALQLPYAGPRIRKMLAVYILLLFLVPGPALDLVGYSYSAIEGSPITKIHISTYCLSGIFAAFVLSYPQKSNLLRYYLSAKIGTIYFISAAIFLLINAIVNGRNGFGMFFDTNLHLFLCCMVLPFVPPWDMDRLERFFHVFFAVNAILAIVELASGSNVFPLTTYSPDGMETVEPRATAFLSHPLHAATITAAYVVSLMLGAGRLLEPRFRMPMIGLQIVALLAFGGRTALLLVLAIIGIAVLWRALQFLAGARVSRRGLTAAVAMLPIGVATLAALASAGAFDQFLDRFSEDGGSARSRTLMLPLLRSFDWADFLWGGNTDYVRAQVYSFGLEWGVENPFIQVSVYQGVVMAVLIMSGFALMLIETCRRLDRRVIVVVCLYVFLCSTFGSFAGRFINFSMFVIMISTLFRRRNAPARFIE